MSADRILVEADAASAITFSRVVTAARATFYFFTNFFTSVPLTSAT